MNPGDLKNTFIDKNGIERTVVIPAEVFRQARRDKISNKVAIQQYLASEGYLDQTLVEETKTAEKSKQRTRKPNEQKAQLIQQLTDMLTAAYGPVEVINPERQVRFEIDGKTFEFTLVQKRK